MYRILCEFMAGLSGDSGRPPPSCELAVMALLVEIGRADQQITPGEYAVMLQAATQVLALPPELAQQLLAEAHARVEQSISLDEFTSVINRELSAADKRRCLVALWRVALADGRLDRYEEYFLRRLCDLLHLSHADFIQAKFAAGAG